MDADDSNADVVDFQARRAARAAGLDPYQRARLMHADIRHPLGPVRLCEDLSADDLRGSLLLENARLLLGKLKDGGQRATAKGNLNREFVRALAAEMRMPERYIELQPYIKVTREGDVWPLETLRVVLRVAGLVRKYKGTFQITRRGLDLSTEHAAGRLQTHLFRTFFGTCNLAYLDNMDDDAWLQGTFVYSLWMIGRLAEGWTAMRTIWDVILAEANPGRLAHERALREAGPASHLLDRPFWRFETRIVRPLMDFGLLEARRNPDTAGEAPRRRIDPDQVRKTSLFDRFVSFELDETTATQGLGRTGAQRTKESILQVDGNVARVKVTLKGVQPPIWRRIEILTSVTFREFSDVIVAALGWSNSHLHEFEIGRRGDPGQRSIGMTDELDEVDRFFGPPLEDDRQVTLADALKVGGRMTYCHDFGDNWEFQILVEAIAPAEEGTVHPRVIAGRRAAPPEDCGGTWAYEELVALLSRGEGAGEDEHVQWLRECHPYFSPEEFDLAAANKAVLDPTPYWE
jgi:hypothetical protein